MGTGVASIFNFIAELDLLDALVLADDGEATVSGARPVEGIAEGGLGNTGDTDVDLAIIADVDIEVAVGGTFGAILSGNKVHGRLGLDTLADVGIDCDAVRGGVGAALADLAVVCTVAHILGVLAEHVKEVGDLNTVHVGLSLLKSEALGSVGVVLVAMVGFEAVLHRDLAIVGLAVDIVVVTVGDGVARVLVLDGTGDGGLEGK